MQCDIRRLSLLHNKIHENFGNFVGNLRLTVCERIMRQLIVGRIQNVASSVRKHEKKKDVIGVRSNLWLFT